MVYAGGALAILLLIFALWIRLPQRQLSASFALAQSTLGVSLAPSARREIPPPDTRAPRTRRTIPRRPLNAVAAYAHVAPAEISLDVVETVPDAEPPAILASARAIGSGLASFSTPAALTISPRARRVLGARPPPLVPLYATFATLQIADAITTIKALKHPGVRETNPFVKPFANNVPAMVLLKSASTAVTVVAVEKLWRKNRVAAVATMIGINAAYGVIVSRNAAAAASAR